jgi:hypothetical protein
MRLVAAAVNNISFAAAADTAAMCQAMAGAAAAVAAAAFDAAAAALIGYGAWMKRNGRIRRQYVMMNTRVVLMMRAFVMSAAHWQRAGAGTSSSNGALWHHHIGS